MSRSRPKVQIKSSTISHIIKFFGFSKSPFRSIIAILMLGVSIGVAYEEMVGIGTWHSHHPKTDKINICFTPPSGCGNLIAIELAKAQQSIHMQAYGLTSQGILHQLYEAKKRGVEVHILLDGGNLSDNNSIYKQLKNNKIEVFFDKMSGIAHNKVIIIDKEKVITGSFNFTSAADYRNAENVLLIEDKWVAQKYLDNWESRKNVAK